jgi:hypothetical protein
MPDRLGGGASQVHPIIVVAMVLVAVLILAVPRKRVLGPFLGAAFLIPMDQMVLLGPFHFQMLRILILCGWVAMLIHKRSEGPVFSNGFNGIDGAVILWTIFTAIAAVALWQDTASLNNQLGALYTVFGIYFLLRFFVRDEQDVQRAIQVIAYVSAVIALIMLWETITHRNPYALLGGSRAFTREMLMAREGGSRALGPFQHPILAGVFGGISPPLFVALWWKDRSARTSAAVGILASTVIVITSQSSTPMLAYAGGIFALCLWPLRKRMRMMRWGLVIALTGLHLVMKAPVWSLIARIDLTGGSSSYHRYQLVDQCIRHFSDWWLMGVKNWGEWGWDMWDLANQYVSIADTSGMLPLILFISIIVYGFKYLGRARRAADKNQRRQELFIWALGAALFANCMAFLGIAYYDQTMVAWYLLLAIIWAAVQSPALAHKKVVPVPLVEQANSAYAIVQRGPSVRDLICE